MRSARRRILSKSIVAAWRIRWMPPPVWRYIAKDCLREPGVTAVEEFRKAIAEAEKPHPPKSPDPHDC